MSRVAAIDCGTNSIRLLIADITGDNFQEITREMEIVRLGQGVDATGKFDSEAIERTLAATRKYAEIIASKGVEKMIMSQEVLQAWANDSLAIAEKIQLRAFTIGIDLGAKIMLQEGKFGRKVSQILGDFSIQEDE
jgi:hypothetical protein